MKKTAMMILMLTALTALTACSSNSAANSTPAETTASTAVQTAEQTTILTEQTTFLTEKTTVEQTTAQSSTSAETSRQTEKTTVSETTAAATVTTSANTASSTDNPSADDAKTEEISLLIQKYPETLDGIATGFIKSDDQDNKTVRADGYDLVYSRVTDQSIQSVADYKAYLEQYLTGDQLEYVWNYSQVDYGQVYKEFDGKLYVCRLNKGAEFDELKMNTMQIKQTASGYDVTLMHNTHGDDYELLFRIADTEKGLRISKVEYTD